jgi:hypothetical protein
MAGGIVQSDNTLSGKVNPMNNENDNRNPETEEADGKWGLIVVLIFVFGIPILGILLNLLRDRPAE